MKATKNIPTNEATAPKWVAYYRVSTKKQGLGLEAQRARVEAAAAEAGANIVMEIEEKESGKECSRPGLNKALAEARKHGAIVCVAKHDRLSRDLSFAAELVFNSGLQFNILSLPPEATTSQLLFGVYFGLAAEEAKLISERTSAALQALKAKGVKLGCPASVEMQVMREHFAEQVRKENPGMDEKEVMKQVKIITINNVDYQNLVIICCPKEMRAAADEAKRRKAAENPKNVAAANEIRRYLREHTDRKERGLQRIADHLTAGGYYTSRGVFHTAKSVDLLCKRYDIAR